MAKNEEGKYLVVQKFLDGPRLTFIDIQQGHKGKIFTCETIRYTNRIALKFECETYVYHAMVDNGKLKLVGKPDKPRVQVTESHLFKKGNRGSNEYYSLESVAEPGYFLYINPLNEVTLSNSPQYCVLITNLHNH